MPPAAPARRPLLQQDGDEEAEEQERSRRGTRRAIASAGSVVLLLGACSACWGGEYRSLAAAGQVALRGDFSGLGGARTPTLLGAEDDGACTAPAVDALTGLPQVQVVGDADPPPPPQRKWYLRVCTEMYEGPNCSNASSWEGEVFLCVEGKRIPGVVKMHTRGHVSKMFPKMQFGVKLEDDQGLMGMAPSKKWVLATSFVDTSFQRNPTAFELYRELGGWAPRTRFAKLQWGDQDFGLYYLGEKIERREGRLEIPKGKKHHPKHAGYLITIDWPKEGKFVVTTEDSNTSFSVLYPKDPSGEQEDYARDFLQEVDKRVADSHSTASELLEVIDIPSMVRYSIVEELAKDVDGYAFSDYLSIHDGKLHHAAPWDFDLGFGFNCDSMYFKNVHTHEDTSKGAGGWNIENPRDNAKWIGADGDPGGAILEFGSNRRQFWLNLWGHQVFRSAFARTWRQQRRGPLSDAAIAAAVQRRIDEIEVAAVSDIELWHMGTGRCAFFECCSHEASGDFHASSDRLLEYLASRSRWIDEHIGDLDHTEF